MILAAALIALGIFLGLVYFANVQKTFHVKPRALLAQVTIAGTTEEHEQMHSVITLFVDESPAEHAAKLQMGFKIREDRLKFQNDRMIALREQSMKLAEEAKQEAERLGLQAKVTPFKQV